MPAGRVARVQSHYRSLELWARAPSFDKRHQLMFSVLCLVSTVVSEPLPTPENKATATLFELELFNLFYFSSLHFNVGIIHETKTLKVTQMEPVSGSSISPVTSSLE